MSAAKDMTREELGARIERIERADSPRYARQLARDFAPLFRMLDAGLRTRLIEALEAKRIDTTEARAAFGLATGESWLLLHAGAGEGRVARLVAKDSPKQGGAGGIAGVSLAPVLRALTGLAGAHCRALPAELAEPYVGVVGADRGTEAETKGDSLQLSAAVALLSRALGKAPTSSCAGTARVRLDGTLAAVTHVAEKVGALARDYPEVRSVVVAADQDLPELDVGVSLVRVKTLEEALPHFALDIDALGSAALDAHQQRAATFPFTNRKTHDASDWRTLSLQAWESCSALAEHDSVSSGRCRAWAALFAVHAGDTRFASELVHGDGARVLEENLALAVEMQVVRATLAIDCDAFEAAATEAEHAVRRCDELERSEQKLVRGKALGTLGRARMHAGRVEEAESVLRSAVDFHLAHARDEVPQSRSYLATCLRLAGRLDEAMAVVGAALEDVAPRAAKWDAAKSTQRFLFLERGRILIEKAAYDDAERDLLALTVQPGLTSYPRLGAERSLVGLRIAAGRPEAAHGAFARCLAASRELLAAGNSPTLARVAAVGVAEGLLALSLAGREREDAKAVWYEAFGLPATPEDIATVLERWIF